MKFLKIALLGTAALAAASVSARADSLDSLKAAIDNLNIGAVADAPAAAAPATVMSWGGFVRVGIGTTYNPAAFPTQPAGGSNYATDIVGEGELQATAKTQTAVGEVGVNLNYRTSTGDATWGFVNGQDAALRTDDYQGWWKMTPNLTWSGGSEGILYSSYSWDNVATNWLFGQTGGGTIRLGYAGQNDPMEMMLAYADGPLGFAVQAYDGNNVNNASAVGLVAKASYKMDAFGFDLGASYAGNAPGPNNSYAVWGGLGYSAGAFSLGASMSTAAVASSSITNSPGSAFVKFNLSDSARVEAGVTHDFTAVGNPTTFGAGLYYSPAKQITFGLEGGGVSGGASNGLYTAGVLTQFSF